YEYLMQMYASQAGKSGGEYYTPQEVSEVLARITAMGKKRVNKVYDPAAGSGSLLLKYAKVLGRENVGGFFGQEINLTTYNLARINMFLHDVNYEKFHIAHGDTLLDPQHWDDEPFDAIVSNPPYSIKWEGDANPLLINDERFAPAGVLAPKSKADLAFTMHIHSWWQIVLPIVYELVGGLLIGLAVGFGGVALIRHGSLPSSGLYALMAVAVLLLSYELATVAGTSGFLAVYAAGVVLGNSNLPYQRAVIGFAEALAWLAQICLFVMLGLLVFPAQIPQAVLPALLIGAVLLFVARPLSVAAASVGRKVPLAEQVFCSWAGLRGAVPIVLATIPISNGLSGGWEILHIVFILVVVFTLLQGTTLPFVARRLRLTGQSHTQDVEVEVAVLDEMAADLMTVSVPDDSRLGGLYIADLRLPPASAVSLVVRGAVRFVPDQQTRIRGGDQLLVVVASEQREATERRVRALARSGRLARWFDDDGEEDRPGEQR
ncbi:MAG: potassium/proton antiporter, partial [Cumulibacter sp.]